MKEIKIEQLKFDLGELHQKTVVHAKEVLLSLDDKQIATICHAKVMTTEEGTRLDVFGVSKEGFLITNYEGDVDDDHASEHSWEDFTINEVLDLLEFIKKYC